MTVSKFPPENPAVIMSDSQPSTRVDGSIWVDTDSDVTSLNESSYAPVANPTFSGVATFPAGSAGAPSITTSGDTNTGVHFPAADTVAIATGGTERVRVTSAGRLGIGTNHPGAPLSLIGDLFASDFASDVLLYLTRASGTTSAPTIVSNGDQIANLTFAGFDGSAYRNAASIRVSVDGEPGASDMPGRIGFLTTADGGTTLTERMRIDSNGLITGTGTSLGAWTSWTPTVGGTGWAIGNAAVVGRYMQLGKLVLANVRIIWGNTSTFGAGVLSLTLPVTAASAQARNTLATGDALDASASLVYQVRPRLSGTTTVEIATFASPVTYVQSTNPFTWADTDHLAVMIAYEAA